MIETERANFLLRTQRRIAQLRSNEDSRNHEDDEDPVPERTLDSNYCWSWREGSDTSHVTGKVMQITFFDLFWQKWDGI